MAHRNGVPPAPPGTSGAFSSRPAPPRTEFPPDQPPSSWRGWLYVLTRQQLWAIPLIRWLAGGMFVLGVVWGLGRWPGGWWVTLAWFSAALLLLFARRLAARSHFIRFLPQPLPAPSPARLAAAVKLPVYVTGHLSVEGRQRAFTCLPGFYRTFATREHALICQLRSGRLLSVGAFPDDEPGLWYAFFTPPQIVRISPGVVAYGQRSLPALAVTYDTVDQKERRRTTLFLSFPNPPDRLTVLADLLADQTAQPAILMP